MKMDSEKIEKEKGVEKEKDVEKEKSELKTKSANSKGLLKFLDSNNDDTQKEKQKKEREKIQPLISDRKTDEKKEKPKFKKGSLQFEQLEQKKPNDSEKTNEIVTNESNKIDPVLNQQVEGTVGNEFFRDWISNKNPFGEALFAKKLPPDSKEKGKSAYLYLLDLNDMFIKDLEEGILISSEYDARTNKVILQFYDTQQKKMVYYLDQTNFEPYCYHKKPAAEIQKLLKTFQGFKRVETVKKIDLIRDKEIEVSKIIADAPNYVGGKNSIKEVLDGAWEADIRFHHNYLYDRQLIVGLPYTITNGIIKPKDLRISEDVLKRLKEYFQSEAAPVQEMAERYQKVFAYSVEDFKRVAIDIEVEFTPGGAMPDPKNPEQAIISVSFVSNDGLKRVYFLDRSNIPLGNNNYEWPENVEIFRFRDEMELIKETFRILWDYPMIVTFNGDNFDLPYLFFRADKLKIPRELNPISVTRAFGLIIKSNGDLKHAIHMDLYQVFSNRSLKGYAFGGGWLRNGLEEISMHMLGQGKVKHADIPIDKMHLCDLVYYNLYDSILTLELTRVNNNLVLNLLIILARITKLPLDDLYRSQISNWIKSLLYYEHRFRNYLIPTRKDIQNVSIDVDDYINETESEELDYDGINFQGAYVIQPVPGIHFDVDVLDFSSLYPSIIKTKNLSYETVNCIHEECKTNILPVTTHYGCKKRMGIFAYVVGFLRDIRVKWFKPISSDKSLPKNERDYAKVIQSALKVFINGSYGVFGSPAFPLFCLPVAESTTAIGRFSIQSTIEKAKSMGIQVLYGDSDSVFLLHPTEEQIKELVKWSAEILELDLDKEKTYKFLALSERKKNYLGIHKGSNYIEIKGMLARKHNTPQFIKKIFAEAMELIAKIDNMETFEKNKKELISIIKKGYQNIGKPVEKGGFPIDEYAISVVLSKPIESYVKAIPQHVTAAKMLPPVEQMTLTIGSIISYVKTRTKEGVKPVNQANISELDVAKYRELLESTFEQVLDAFNLDFDEIKGAKKLDTFFKQ